MNRVSSERSLQSVPRLLVGGRKRRFGITGILNVVITNIILQAAITVGLPTALATLVSQLFNGSMGYLLYGRLVFLPEGPRTGQEPLRYLAMFIGLWISNWAGINMLTHLVQSKNLAALIMIPVLAVCSYVTQKNWVFARP